MLKPKKKVGRPNLKEDKFIKFIMDSKSFMDENYTKVLTYGGTAFAVIVIFFLLKYINSEKRDKANGMLGIAQIEYSTGNYSKAAQRLKLLLEEYGSTNEADQGRFLLANIYYQQKRYTEAQPLYEEFIDSFSGSDILLASAQAGLAACYEEQDDYSSAAEWYLTAAETAGTFSEGDSYRYLAGLCYKKIGNLELAKEQFEQLAQDSQKARDAEAQLMLIQGSL
jgi:tetratricopeptide (TPR) repeat protein